MSTSLAFKIAGLVLIVFTLIVALIVGEAPRWAQVIGFVGIGCTFGGLLVESTEGGDR